MLISFSLTDNLLNTEPFCSEEVRFNLLHRVCEGASAMMLRRTDGRAILAQSGHQFPAWIWTAELLTPQEIHELADDFYTVFAGRDKLEFVAKPGVAKILADDFGQRAQMNSQSIMNLLAYHCPTVLMPTGIPGEVGHPTPDDTATIAYFLAGFVSDCYGNVVNVEQMLASARQYIQSANFYVWKVGGEIVSMANIAHRSPRHARINEVYTPPLHRKKGYASALVAALSQNVLQEGLVPMLYADAANPVSNKVYQDIGYLECGTVTQITLVRATN